ncbi:MULTISPECIES: hypothetical protein [Flavobacterium]|uniref:hypothetical protein n=1 Tax=Flavobacterium TaxID=237 RepID=UPI001FCAE0C3|nr:MULTISPECIES: hypothetical protein [Flavobacterium]UOK41635.1 hypothetical protein LZF87_09965 [Flavobacterium enshiense]
MKNETKFSTETILPIIIILLSVMNISNHTDDLISLSVLNSLIGIIGSALFFLKKPISTRLIYTWIVAQILIIDPIFDLSQGFNFKFGFTLGLKSGDVGLNINILAILMLGFIKILEAANLIGKRITLKNFRDNELEYIFPINGTITERISLENEKNWLLVELDNSFSYDGQNINKILTKRKDDKTIKLKAKNQISFLRIVLNENDLTNTSDKSKFPFIDWIICE